MFVVLASSGVFHCAMVTGDPIRSIDALNVFHPAKTPLIYQHAYSAEIPQKNVTIWAIIAPIAREAAKWPKKAQIRIAREHATAHADTPGESHIYFNCDNLAQFAAALERAANGLKSGDFAPAGDALNGEFDPKSRFAWLEGRKIRHALGRSQISGIVHNGVVSTTKGKFTIWEIDTKHRELCNRDKDRVARFEYLHKDESVENWIDIM